ncbi:TIGR04197 family type VII secretion effector [Ruminococcus sp. LCP21S3_E8]
MSKTSNKRLMGQRSGQIKVNTASVQKSADKIKTLSNTVRNRKLTVEFTYSKGEVVKQLENYAKALKSTGEAVADLMEKTSILLNKTAKQFEKADKSIARQILKEEKK